MNNASTPDGRGQDRPNDAEPLPFFPSEGSFNAVVPLSELGQTPAPLVPFDAADVGKPAEAAWAREAHRARPNEEDETLVPSRARRARRARPSWLVTASVIVLSVAAGLASGTYLIWSAQRAPEAQASAPSAAEAPSLPPAPVAEQLEADRNVEPANEPVRVEKPREVAKTERTDEVAPAPKSEPHARTPGAPRAERSARTVAEPKETTPAPKPAPPRRAPSSARLTTAEQQPPATPARTLPVSSPPPSAKSKKVIQWP